MTLKTTTFVLQRPVFEVTSAAWHEVGNKMHNADFQDALNLLHIEDYSDVVKEIYFTFIVLPDDVQVWRNSHSKYHWSRGLLAPIAWLDYAKFAQATDKGAIQMQAQAYLDTILTFPSIKGLKKNPFDYQQFYKDVKALFEKEGWI